MEQFTSLRIDASNPIPTLHAVRGKMPEHSFRVVAAFR